MGDGLVRCSMIKQDLDSHSYLRYKLETEQGWPVNEEDLGIKEWPHKWPSGTVTYQLNNFSNDIPDQNWQFRAVSVALREWEMYVKDIKFDRVYGDPAKPADIEVTWRNPKDDDYLQKNPNTLGYAWMPTRDPRGNDKAGDVTINDGWLYSLFGDEIPAYIFDPVNYDENSKTTMATETLINLLKHEFGHSIGLVHDEHTSDSMMWPYGQKRVMLGPRDIARIQLFYGRSNVSKRRIDAEHERIKKRFDFRTK